MKRSIPVILAAVFLTACSGEPTDNAREEAGEASQSYVALGDSYAAMGGRDQPLRGEPFCLRSAGNYPELISADVIDVTCQGAVTDDLLQPRDTGKGQLPAQLDALDADTTLVTVSIGGNDLGFGDVARCISSRMQQPQPVDCVDVLGADIQQRLEQVPSGLDRVHEQITERAGDAQVVVTGYLPLLTEDECPELAGVSERDRAWAVTLTDDINRVVRDAAGRHGADFVLPDSADTHTACAAPEHRWTDIRGVETDAYPLHLTSAGHEAMAEAALEILSR